MNRPIQRSVLILGVLCLLLGTALPLLAQDATFELTKDVPTAGKMLAQAGWDKVWNDDDAFEYGNWYGPGYWGGGREKGSPGNKPPVDELDAIAQRHDFSYQIAEEMGKIHGAKQEQLLKALADEIAVRDAKQLPEDPRDWDPPAPNPASADAHRDRIGFGFSYLSRGRAIKALVFETEGEDPDLDFVMTAAELEEQARARATTWSSGIHVRWLYRIDLAASAPMVAENESVGISVSMVPVHAATPSVTPGELPFAIGLTLKGSGELSATQLTSTDTSVVLTASNWGYFFSNNGGTLTVKAAGRVLRSADADPDSTVITDVNIDVLPGEVSVTVAAKTRMELTATPESLHTDYASQVGCYKSVVRAQLTDWNGKGIEGIPLKLSRDDGSTSEGTTDSNGVASWTELFCDTLFSKEGQMAAPVTLSVSMLATKGSNGTVYIASSDSVTVTLFQQEFLAVTGRVFDRRHSVSVKDATVQIDGPNGSETSTTDGNGQFRVMIPAGSGHAPKLTGTVTAKGFESATFGATSDGVSHTVHLDPVEVMLTGQVVDAISGEPLDGATVHVTEPLDRFFDTHGGAFSITGVYFGDRVTMSGGAGQHKSYVKSGIIREVAASVTFRLPRGTGDVSGGLDPEETDATQPVVLPKIHDLMVWASPADPGVMQSVTVIAQVFPADAGVLVEISMHGTDGYSASISGMTDAMGKVRLPIPGAESGVLDAVVARIVGESVTQRLRYSF